MENGQVSTHAANPYTAKPGRHPDFVRLGKRFEDALLYAVKMHREQARKQTPRPYVGHLLGVASIVLEHGGTEDQAIAALLHDAVEDAPAGQGGAVLADIQTRFGTGVAAIVEACSDGLDASGNRSGTWAERKRPYVAGLSDPAKKPDEAMLVTAADKIHNGLCIAADVRRYGQHFWSVFNASRDELLWYYTSVEAAITARLPDSSISGALHRAVDELVAAAGADRSQIQHELPERDAVA